MLQTDADIVPGDSGGPLARRGRQGDRHGHGGLDRGATATASRTWASPSRSTGRITIADQIITGKKSSTIQVSPTGFIGVSVAGGSAASSASPTEQQQLQLQAENAGGASGGEGRSRSARPTT